MAVRQMQQGLDETRARAALGVAKSRSRRTPLPSRPPTARANETAWDNQTNRPRPTKKDQTNIRRGGGGGENAKSGALGLARSLASGKRNKSKSKVKQLTGEAAARGGQMLGGVIGSTLPLAGTTIGAAVGKRIGRVLGENWWMAATVIFCLVAPQVFVFGMIIFLIISLGNLLGIL